MFDSASLGTPEDQQSSSGGVLGDLFSSFSAPKAAPSGAKSIDKREQEVLQASAAWNEAVAHLFIFAAVAIVGQDLAPSEDEAGAITRPLVKILMRHYDPARQASNDVLDAFTCLVAMSLYMQRIAPAYRAAKAEQKVRAFRGSGPKVVPIDRGQSAAVAQPSRPAGVAAAATPAGSAGLRADTVRSDAGVVLSRPEGQRQPESGDGFIGASALEEAIGGPLV